MGKSKKHKKDNLGITSLDIRETTEGFFERLSRYDWEIKSEGLSSDPLTIEPGETQGIIFNLGITKKPLPYEDYVGVRGVISIDNIGEHTTENLSVTNAIEYRLSGPGQQFQPVENQTLRFLRPVSETNEAELSSGQTGTYEYEIVFTPVEGAVAYRHVVTATIDNHPEDEEKSYVYHETIYWGILEAPPSSPMIEIEEDATASITDIIDPTNSLANLFQFEFRERTTSGITGNTTIPIRLTVENVNAPCGRNYTFSAKVVLTETDSGVTHSDTTTVTIFTGACPPITFPRTYGYWKNHPEQWPVHSLTLGGLEYSKDELMLLLKQSTPCIASLQLAHQLIAAKLNVMNYEDIHVTVDQAMTQADSIFTRIGVRLPLENPIRLNSNTGRTMVELSETLELYNSGHFTAGWN